MCRIAGQYQFNKENISFFELEKATLKQQKRGNEHLTPLGASKLWQVDLLEYWLEQQGI